MNVVKEKGEDLTMNPVFQSYQLSENLVNITEKLQFKEPTPIQQRVIPHALKRKNIIGQSQTGSGKTHAYLIPLLDQINIEEESVQTVIIAPTRELAIQIHEEVKKMVEFSNVKWKSRLVIGGTDKKREMQKFNTQPHIVVGTPGRLLDFIKENVILTSQINHVVIDEADLLIDLGLIEEVDQILYRMYEDVRSASFFSYDSKKFRTFIKEIFE